MADPIHQFQIHDLVPLGKIGSTTIAFTNSAFYMALAGGLTAALMLGATAGRQLVPGRMQSIAELAYEFVADTIRNTIGEGGMRFFPLVFSLFMFILVSNVVGLIPYQLTVMSHIIVTAALALLVFFTVIIYGFWKNGLHFFNLFVPKGIPRPGHRILLIKRESPVQKISVFVREQINESVPVGHFDLRQRLPFIAVLFAVVPVRP